MGILMSLVWASVELCDITIQATISQHHDISGHKLAPPPVDGEGEPAGLSASPPLRGRNRHPDRSTERAATPRAAQGGPLVGALGIGRVLRVRLGPRAHGTLLCSSRSAGRARP
jgi:hypothetical protein